jgi:hypothetical protein
MNDRAAEGRDTAVGPGRLALLVVAGAVAVAVVPWWILRDWDASPESRAFVSTPQFVLWVLILCGQAAVWVGAAAFVIATIARRWRDLWQRKALPAQTVVALATTVAVLLLLALLLLFGTRWGIYEAAPSLRTPSGSSWPLAHHTTKVTPLVGTALFIGGLAIAGMWLTTIALADLTRHGLANAASVTRFVELRTELTALLAVAGTLVGLATLSSGALREAVLAAGAEPVYRNKTSVCLERQIVRGGATAAEARRRTGEEFDELLERYPRCAQVQFEREYVLAYGLLFTGILGIAFAPSYLFLRRAGARLRDDSFPLPDPRATDFFEVIGRRDSFDALLQTNLSATATFKAGVAIFTPLAASVISAYLPA